MINLITGQSGVAFLSTPPAENSAPARVAPAGKDGQGVCILTIDTGRLADLYLPAFRELGASVAHMDKLCMSAARRRSSSHMLLNVARCVTETELCRVVSVITERGGLLFLGGK